MSTFGKIGARDLVWKPPYDAEIEYIKGTGTQYLYIENFMPIGFGLEIECTFKMDNNIAQTRVINFNVNGVYYENNTYWYFDCYRNGSNQWALAQQGKNDATKLINWSGAVFGTANTIKTTVNFSWDNLQNDTMTGYTTVANLGTLKRNNVMASVGIMAMVVPGHAYKMNGRVYSFISKLNNVTTIDMIPVRCGQVGYMFDRANIKGGPFGNGLYPNAGTGTFVLGPDKVGGGKCIELSESAFYAYSSDSFWKEAA